MPHTYLTVVLLFVYKFNSDHLFSSLPASLQSTGRPPPSSSTETATGTSPTRQPAPRQTAPRQTGRQITKHSQNTSSSSATLSNTTVPLAHSVATAHGSTQGPTQGATPRGLSPVGHTPPGHTPPMLMSSPSPSGTVPRLHAMMPQFRKPPPLLPSHAQSGWYSVKKHHGRLKTYNSIFSY